MKIDFAVGMFVGGALTLVLRLGLVTLTKLVYDQGKGPDGSGYYWAYTLDMDGKPLESVGRPTIIWYSAYDKTILEHGYDVPIQYDGSNHQLLERIEYR